MTISVDWDTKIISIPKVDTTLIQASPTEIRELNLNDFRMILKGLEDGEEGMVFLDTHRHNTEVSVGGLTLARVIELINGYTVTFEDGQYAVNLTEANSNVGDNINVNQVSVRSFNSAGLISSPAIEYASFNGGVTVDIGSSYSGTLYPIGTPQQPVNNISDALLIANTRGFTTLYITGNITLNSGTDFDEINFVGEAKTKTIITIDVDADVSNCEFYDAEIQGTLDGGNVLKNCLIGTISYVNGYIEQCVLKSGTITLGGSAEAHFLDCWTGVIGGATPIIDMGGSGQGLGMRNYNGDIVIKNKSGSEKISLDLNSGVITLDSTVTNGEIDIRGIGHLNDNSVGATIESHDLLCIHTISDGVWEHSTAEFMLKVIKNKKSLVKSGSVWKLIVYDDDNITPLLNKDLKDSTGNNITDLAAGTMAQELKTSV
jgi:hypothetical protein